MKPFDIEIKFVDTITSGYTKKSRTHCGTPDKYKTIDDYSEEAQSELKTELISEISREWLNKIFVANPKKEISMKSFLRLNPRSYIMPRSIVMAPELFVAKYGGKAEPTIHPYIYDKGIAVDTLFPHNAVLVIPKFPNGVFEVALPKLSPFDPEHFHANYKMLIDMSKIRDLDTKGKYYKVIE
jgi:hypothetical protein